MTPKLLTVQEVAGVLRVHARTAYRLVTDGSIRAVKIGSQWRVPEQALLDFLATGTPMPGQGKKEPVQKQHKLPL